MKKTIIAGVLLVALLLALLVSLYTVPQIYGGDKGTTVALTTTTQTATTVPNYYKYVAAKDLEALYYLAKNQITLNELAPYITDRCVIYVYIIPQDSEMLEYILNLNRHAVVTISRCYCDWDNNSNVPEDGRTSNAWLVGVKL